MRAQVWVRDLEHRDGHVVALSDPRKRLPRPDVVVDERHALVDRQVGIALCHLGTGPARHAHDDFAPRRCDAPNELRVQLEHRRHGRVGQPRQHVEPGGIGD